jgi:hypothetical protein
MKAPTRRRALLLLLLVASSVTAGLCDTNPQDGQFSPITVQNQCSFYCSTTSICVVRSSLHSLSTFFVCIFCWAASALRSLMSQWTNYPSTWTSSGDPCDGSWDGIMCSNGRITSL